MITLSWRTRLRCLTVWAGATAPIAAFAATTLPEVCRPLPLAFDLLLVRAAQSALLACAGWAWLATSAVVLEALLRPSSPRMAAARRLPGVPRAMRRLVLAACGIAVLAGATNPAIADGIALPSTMARQVADELAAVPLSHNASHNASHDAGSGYVRAVGTAAEAWVVRPGESLWLIAAERLGAGASGARVAAEWHRIYAANRAVIGDQPELIRPGQQLILPAGPLDE